MGIHGPVVLKVRFGSISSFCQRVSPKAMWIVWGLELILDFTVEVFFEFEFEFLFYFFLNEN